MEDAIEEGDGGEYDSSTVCMCVLVCGGGENNVMKPMKTLKRKNQI
jgi:hypothetical protein